jgi:predicted lipid-binding transport protein (Tim44 family)
MKAGHRHLAVYWFCLALLGLVLIFTIIPETQARMGGGHSFSGGSSSGGSGSSGSSSGSGGGGWGGGSSSGSGGGSWGGSHWGGSASSGYANRSGTVNTYSQPPIAANDRSTLLIEIVFLILVIYVLIRLLNQGSFSGNTNTVRSRPLHDLTVMNASLDDKLQEMKTHDANFSKVVFIDFACLIYHKFYSYRGSEEFRLIAPYISKSIADQTTTNIFYQQQRIHDIVIGKAKIVNIGVRERNDSILVEFESNLSLQYLKTDEKVRLINRERWLFERQTGLLSPQPEQMRTLSCPSCGAPADFSDAGECQYCHTFIQAGEKQWQIVKINVIDSQPFKTEDPGGYVEEVGTNFSTFLQPGLENQTQEFLRRHKLGDRTSFFNGFCEQVVKPYFLATYAAWSKGDWRKARHLVSDRLYESNGFWMDEYARTGWRNRLENIDIQAIELVRIDLDTFYDSVTVRVFASCLDYTVNQQGKLIGGSSTKPRVFSEYWTFMRTAGVEKIDKDYDLKSCPSCGAPADKVGQTGVCDYCGAKITEGHFSWVLAVITQDEVYEG